MIAVLLVFPSPGLDFVPPPSPLSSPGKTIWWHLHAPISSSPPFLFELCWATPLAFQAKARKPKRNPVSENLDDF